MMTMLVLLALAQDEEAIAKASRDTLEKGSFTVQIAPAAEMKDALPKDRLQVAGVTIVAEHLADGTFRATDGTWELIGRSGTGVLRAKHGWARANDVAAALREEIERAAGESDKDRGNVSNAKENQRRLISLQQMVARSIPPTGILTGLQTEFKRAKKGGTESVDGKSCTLYEGTLKDLSAQALLVGPYGEYVKSGGLKIIEFSGAARVWVNPDGLVVKTEHKAAGKYSIKDDRSNRIVPVGVTVTCKFVKIGITTYDVPKEAEDKIAEMIAEGSEK